MRGWSLFVLPSMVAVAWSPRLHAAPAVPAPAQRYAVLLYDGRLPAQVELEASVRQGFQPHAGRVMLRTLHAGRAESLPFMRRHNLRREDAPVLLVMDGPEPRQRIARRLKAQDDVEPQRNLRTFLAALKLPVPAPVTPPAGPIAAWTADGGAEEQRFAVLLAGPQRVSAAGRELQPGAVAVYRLPAAEGLRRADLRLTVSGGFRVDWAPAARGPWKELVSATGALGAAAGDVRRSLTPVISLDETLASLPAGAVYLRLQGESRRAAHLQRVEWVALGPMDPSGNTAWRQEVDRMRAAFAEAFPAESGTPLSGTLRGVTTLTRARSPYLMTGDVLVPAGSTLQIEPGVRIRVLGPRLLRVAGVLLARGTPEQPIELGPVAPRQPDDWGGIHFRANGTTASRGSVLQHCVISRAANVLLWNFEGTLEQNRFDQCAQGLELREGGNPRVNHNLFQRCAVAVAVEGGSGEVRDNLFQECGVALAVRALPAGSARLTFTGNRVEKSRYQAVRYQPPSPAGAPPLLLGGNYWSGTPEERLAPTLGLPVRIDLAPRLEAPPADAGPSVAPAP